MQGTRKDKGIENLGAPSYLSMSDIGSSSSSV